MVDDRRMCYFTPYIGDTNSPVLTSQYQMGPSCVLLLYSTGTSFQTVPEATATQPAASRGKSTLSDHLNWPHAQRSMGCRSSTYDTLSDDGQLIRASIHLLNLARDASVESGYCEARKLDRAQRSTVTRTSGVCSVIL